MLSCRSKLKLTVTPGFFLMLGLMFYLDEGAGVMIWILLSALFHEIGHVCASAAFNGRVESLSLSASGAELRFVYRNGLTYGRENIIALSGPAVNFLLGLPILWAGHYLPAIVSFSLGVFNLLPVVPLDGGRVLSNLIAVHVGLRAAEIVLAITAGVLVGILVGLGVAAAIQYANFTFLFFAGWILATNLGAKCRKKI